MNVKKVRSAGPSTFAKATADRSARVTAECGIIRIHRGVAEVLAHGPWGIDDEDEDDDERGPEGCFRTGIMNNKVKRGILRIRPGGGRALRLDKVSQGGFKDGQGKLRQFKNQFFVLPDGSLRNAELTKFGVWSAPPSPRLWRPGECGIRSPTGEGADCVGLTWRAVRVSGEGARTNTDGHGRHGRTGTKGTGRVVADAGRYRKVSEGN
ncbi:MAG: hypothetical protein JWR19_4235 [Pedosphaera sp.]|nr:hypothetical protein [Pedosphaera sp.]